MTPQRPDMVEFLTGRLSDSPRPRGIAHPGGFGKFSTDGTVLRWPGNTFLCHVPKGPAHDVIRAMQEHLKMSRFQRFYTFLPPESFHMTVFQGVSPTASGFEELPRDAEPGMDLTAVSAVMAGQVAGLSLPQIQSVAMVDVYAGQGLTMRGADAVAEEALRETRRTLRDATGITHAPHFDDYIFHITLAYLMEWLTEPVAQELAAFCAMLSERYAPELAEVTLGPVEFCTFETMHHFEVVKRL